MNLLDSGLLTDDPHEAHLHFIPISCRNQVENQKSTRNYAEGLISYYPYWKRTFGIDHFYVSCQSIGSRADEEVQFLLKNAIRLVCSPSYDSNYISHKDVALPQILELSLPPSADSLPPRHGYDMWNRSIAELPPLLLSPGKKHPPRTKLAFWAGSLNSEVANNLEIFYKGFQGFEFHSVGKMKRRAVLVIMSNYCDLPFNDILDWNNFSVVLKEEDVPDLEKILKGIPEAKFKKMHHNVSSGVLSLNQGTLAYYSSDLQVHKHFKWNSPPVKYDEFQNIYVSAVAAPPHD